MGFFRKVVDDEGNESYVEVDFNEADLSEIPDDAFYGDTRYREVSDRDVKRRQRIKELESQLSETPPVPEEQDSDSTEQTDDPQTVDSLSREEFEQEWARREESLLQRALETVQNHEKTKRDEDVRLQNILKENNLPNDVLLVLQTSEDPESIAKVLARSALNLGTTTNGGEKSDNVQEALARIDARLGLEDRS